MLTSLEITVIMRALYLCLSDCVCYDKSAKLHTAIFVVFCIFALTM